MKEICTCTKLPCCHCCPGACSNRRIEEKTNGIKDSIQNERTNRIKNFLELKIAQEKDTLSNIFPTIYSFGKIYAYEETLNFINNLQTQKF